MVLYANPAILEVDPHDCLGRRCRQCITTVRYQKVNTDGHLLPGEYTAHQRAPWLLTVSTPATGPRWRRCPACGAPA